MSTHDIAQRSSPPPGVQSFSASSGSGPSPGGATGPARSEDGRSLRAERSRAAIANATLAILDGGNLEPSADEIAERAGVGRRTIFRLFRDLDSLFVASAEEGTRRTSALWEPVGEDGSLGDRLDTLLRRRCTLNEALAPVRRAASVRAHRSKIVLDFLRARHEALRGQLESALAADQAAVPGEVLELLDVLLDWPTWERLRREQGLSAQEAESALRRAVNALAG